MTSPDGEHYHGWWKVVALDEAHRLDLGEAMDQLIEMGMEEGVAAP